MSNFHFPNQNIRSCATFLNCSEPKNLLLQKNGFDIFECLRCKHRYCIIENYEVHLEQNFSDDYFFAGKDGYPDYLENREILHKAGLRYASLANKFMRPGKVLDVGSAAGFILKGFVDKGWKGQGIEPNKSMANWGRENLGLDIVASGLEEFTTKDNFDLVSMIQVNGSLYDLDTAFSRVRELLNKDGYVLLESWDRDSRWAKLSGKYWHEYCPPTVLHWFSDQTLDQFMNHHGFQLISKGKPVKKIKMRHGLSLLDHSTPPIPGKSFLLRNMAKLIGNATVRYPSWDLKWYLYKTI